MIVILVVMVVVVVYPPIFLPEYTRSKSAKICTFLDILFRQSDKKLTKCKVLHKINKFYAFFFALFPKISHICPWQKCKGLG